MKHGIVVTELHCRVCGVSFPVHKLLDGRRATVRSVGNSGPVLEHIEREHPDEFQGVHRECDELERQNFLAFRSLFA